MFPVPGATFVADDDKRVFRLLSRVFRTAAGAVMLLAAIVVVLYVARMHTDRSVRHGREVGRMAREIRALATDRETSIRGYLLTGDSASLQPELAAMPRLTVALDSLITMTADDPAQHERALRLREAATQWDRDYARPALSAGVRSAAMRASLLSREVEGTRLFNELRRLNATLLDHEEALYVARVKRDRLAELLSLIVMLGALLALGAIVRWMHRRVSIQAKALLDQQAQLEEQAVELEESTAEIEATNEELQEAAVELELANDAMRESNALAEEARVQAEHANAKLESMLDRMTDSFIELDAEWRITYMNKAAEVIGGRTLEEARGRSHWDVYPASVGTEAERQYRKAMTEQVPVAFALHYQEPGVVDVWVEVNAYPSPEALSILFRDVSKQKRAEDIVARRDYQFSEAQRIARLGSWEYDTATGLNTWSEEMCRVLGHAPDAIASLDTMVEQVVEADRSRVRAAVNRSIRDGEAFAMECRIQWPDGSVHTVHARGASSRDDTGRSPRIVGTVQDVTERRELQEQLQQSQKMEAVGQLAGGVAHDFNNVLTAIKSFSELIALELADDSPLRDDVREITAAADRAAALTRHLLAFSRRQMLQPVVLDPNQVIEGLTKMLARLLGGEVRCETSLAPDLGRVLADPGQLEQVLINLAVNARDAMPNGGTLTLETANTIVDERHANRLSGVESAEPGEYVVLAVSDTGTGMDSATRARIFEPFFTTKEAGKGTGLGLSTVYGIVRQSGGYVSVYSEVGRGTAFRIYLPLARGEVHAQAPKVVAEPLPQGKETILLVDDDDAVRMVATRILTRAGYSVLAATSPREAEAVWANHPGPIHLLMTDLMMPDMNGGELAAKLLERRRGSRVLYTSGYTNETVIRRGLIISDVPFLSKPFTIDDVIRKVREALAA